VRSRRATYDIQFGSLERPTHQNTSWDAARFEVVGHKWADLSEGNYGVSLLNDCKYGYDIHDNGMRLTLIKSGISPDPMADQGRHDFTYSLLPHAGDWRSGGVSPEAYGLNVPMLAAVQVQAQAGSLPQQGGFARVEADHVILETLKKSEDDDGSWIVRLYEYKQYRSPAVRVRFDRGVRRAVECNLVEEGEEPVEVQGDCLTFPIQPFEIKTFKVWF
jgi:alpha-mannosidase